jgi:hypothetical protein
VNWNILTMHVLINVKSSNNISKWQMGFNSAFKGLMYRREVNSAYDKHRGPFGTLLYDVE